MALRTKLSLVSILAMATISATVAAAEPSDERLIPFLYRKAELSKIIGDFSRATGERFIYDAKVRGRVTIAVTRNVSLSEARALLHAALLYKGLAAVPGPEGVFKIVEAVLSPTLSALREHPRERQFAPALTIVQLDYADLDIVMNALRPLMGANTIAAPLRGQNAIILASNESQLHRLLGLIGDLDQSASTETLVRKLRYRGSDEILPIIEAAVAATARPSARLEILSDARTNSLVATGSPERLDAVRKAIERIDQPLESEGQIAVLPIRYRNTEKLAELLSTLSSQSQTAPTSPPLRRARAALQALESRRLQLAADVPSHSIVLQADPETLRVVRDLVAELDQPPAQVAIEVTISELSFGNEVELSFGAQTAAKVQGWQILGDLVPSEGALAALGSGTGTGNPLTLRVADPQDALPVFALTASERPTRTRTLQHPMLVTLSGEESRISVGNNIPIPITTQAGLPAGAAVGDPLSNQVTIERQDVGISLAMTPTVSREGSILLDLEIDVTQLVDSQAGDVAEVGPTIEQLRLATRFSLRSGETVVIAGATQPASEEVIVGTPFLRSIPWLGSLFRSTKRVQRERRLVIAIQAWRQLSEDDRAAAAIRSRVAFERAAERSAGLPTHGSGAFAARIATLERHADAEAVADSLGGDRSAFRIVRWRRKQQDLFDLYQVGFDSIADAAGAVNRFTAAGWQAELVPLPDSSATEPGLHSPAAR